MKNPTAIFLLFLFSLITAHGSPDARTFDGIPMKITIPKTKGVVLAETDKLGFIYDVTAETFFSPSSSEAPSFSKVVDIPVFWFSGNDLFGIKV
jgi:hypothetical protein